jgi:hypothetical protein
MNRKNAAWVVFLLAVFAIALHVAVSPAGKEAPRVVFLADRPAEIEVEIADSYEERQRGLMFREYLEPGRGMLFIFEGEGIRNFWMKNTLIPLDMIFISRDLKIVKIHSAVPCTADPCPLYSSERPAMYVVEANRGFAEENGITEGQKVEFRSVNTAS